jgi:REP element-mobilizing transposase RayT
LPEYDYSSPGAYFVTIVAYQREELLGRILDGEMQLNAYGQIVQEEWFKTAVIRPFIRLNQDEFVVMPNHIHGILWFEENTVGATWQVAPTPHPPNDPAPGPSGAVAPTPRLPNNPAPGPSGAVAPTPHPPNGPAPGSLGAVVGQFKSITTRRINALSGAPGVPLWQRNYYEHVIRNEYELNNIRKYIQTNSLRWDSDEENPIHHQE